MATDQQERATFDAGQLASRFLEVRRTTEQVCEPLFPEDCVPQSMPDASPVKWHIAHTTWFFETFVLQPAVANYQVFDPQYRYLFNSYYNAVGERHPRPQRGLLTRPVLDEVFDYRRHVDDHVLDFLQTPAAAKLADVIEVGLHHEQQHQELILTDVKHLLSGNSLRPAYFRGEPRRNRAAPAERTQTAAAAPPPQGWIPYCEGVCEIGFAGSGFCFDNETPRHRVFLEAFELGSRLVTNGEFLDFLDDGGYARPELWLSEGWDVVQREGWQAPLYWEQTDGEWTVFTLSGMQPLDPAEPVCHISYYEADAYARWAGTRLPSEAEWEVAASAMPIDGNLLRHESVHPVPCRDAPEGGLRQMFGDVWEWTASPYVAYPGFRPLPGALGEYNGKFMCNQMVLRGGSCATPPLHIRATYRNFFKPEARWQFSGIRLAR